MTKEKNEIMAITKNEFNRRFESLNKDMNADPNLMSEQERMEFKEKLIKTINKLHEYLPRDHIEKMRNKFKNCDHEGSVKCFNDGSTVKYCPKCRYYI